MRICETIGAYRSLGGVGKMCEDNLQSSHFIALVAN